MLELWLNFFNLLREVPLDFMLVRVHIWNLWEWVSVVYVLFYSFTIVLVINCYKCWSNNIDTNSVMLLCAGICLGGFVWSLYYRFTSHCCNIICEREGEREREGVRERERQRERERDLIGHDSIIIDPILHVLAIVEGRVPIK